MPCTGRRKQALLADWHPGLACQHDPCCCTGRGPARPMLGQCPKRVEMFMLCLQELVSPVQNLQQRSAGSPHAPGDSFPSCHHLSTMGTSYLSEVSANMGAVPGRRRSLAFLLVSMQSAADGAAGSSDQPPLWTRESTAGSSAAIGAPRDSASVCRALLPPPRALPSYSPSPFPPRIFHRCSKALLQPC